MMMQQRYETRLLWWPRAALFGGAGILALLGVAVAAAHARYDHSTPGQGEVVATAPTRVDIFTAQEMRKQQDATQITVADAANARVDAGDTTVDDKDRKHFSVELRPNLSAGRYLVSFKNVSDEDGEADSGQFAFYVGADPTADQKAQDAKLSITSKTEDAKKHGDSHTGLIVGIVAAVVLVSVVAGGGLVVMRRRT